MNYIFLPWAKTFVYPSLMLINHLNTLGEEVKIIATEANFDLLDLLNVSYIKYDEINYLKEIQPFDNLIFFQNNTKEQKNDFITSIYRACRQFFYDPYYISFIPDGLANIYSGPSLMDYIDDSLFNLKLKNIYSFGFQHHTAVDLFPYDNHVLIDYKNLILSLDNRETDIIINNFTNHINTNNIIFIPFRPWCTDSFWSGAYNFGDTNTVGKLYNELIEQIKSKNSEDFQIFFRPDPRYLIESLKAFELIDHQNKVLIDDKDYPFYLPLEPLLHGFFTNNLIEGKKFSYYFISLDSSTFNTFAALIGFYDSKVSKLASFYGAPQKILANEKNGLNFSLNFLEKRLDEISYLLTAQIKIDGAISYFDKSLLYVEL